MKVETKEIARSSETPVSITLPKEIQKLDQLQNRIPLKKMEFPETSPTSLKEIPSEIQTEAQEIAKEFETLFPPGSESSSSFRRLHELLQIIAEIAEKHIFQHEEDDETKKQNTVKTTQGIKSYTNYQGVSHAGAAILPAAFQIVAATLVNDNNLQELIKSLGNLASPISGSLEKLLEASKTPEIFTQQLFFNEYSMDEKHLESMKELAPKIQQLLQRLLELQAQIIRSTGQR